MKKLMAALAGATALSGAMLFATVDDYLYWSPADVSRYDFDKVQQQSKSSLARVVVEEASKSVFRQNLSPVTGAILIDEVLSGYRDMRSASGEGAAMALAIDILSQWDPEGASELETSLGPRVQEFRQKHEGDELYATRVAEAKGLADFDRTTPERPDDETKWFPFLGAVDPDIAGGSMPFSSDDIRMPEVPPPFKAGTLEDEIDIDLVVTATRMASQEQKKNAVFWQGSEGFAKGIIIRGLNPGDVWQIILAQETRGKIDDEAYIDLAAGTAAVIRDAAIAVWKTKYRDWVKRPSMRVPKLEASIGNPSFPSYVSGHAGMAAAAATYLSERDPERAEIYQRLARDSEKSRFFGGVHTVSDNYVGIWLGKSIAAQHLGQDLPKMEPVYGNPQALRLAVDVVNAGLDFAEDAKAAFDRLTSKDGLSFRLADTAPPAPRAKSGPPTANDTMKGTVAAADLDGDGLPELLMAGYRSVRLYGNEGGLEFNRLAEYETGDLNGAYFTKNEGGEIDGFWAFGSEAPVWHRRTGELSFDANGVSVANFPEVADLNVKAVLLEDVDGDGDQDAVMTNYGEVTSIDGFVMFDEEGTWSHWVERTEDGFSYAGRYGEEVGRPLAGGKIDLDGDGDLEEVIVHDNLPLEIKGLEVPMDEGLGAPVAGMSFTPIRVRDGEAMHISNIYNGESELYGQEVGKSDRTDGIDGDILVGLDASGRLVDLAKGGLQSAPLEWSWGSYAGDLNGDGLEDLVIVYGMTPNRVYRCGVRIMMQQPDGSFEPADTQIDIGEFYPRSVLLRDMDADGDLDIVMSSWKRVQVWENTSQIMPTVDHSGGRPDITGFLTQSVK